MAVKGPSFSMTNLIDGRSVEYFVGGRTQRRLEPSHDICGSYVHGLCGSQEPIVEVAKTSMGTSADTAYDKTPLLRRMKSARPPKRAMSIRPEMPKANGTRSKRTMA